jgi:hypothetical protein
MSGHAIHIKIDGRTYAGTYQVDRKILTVTTPYGPAGKGPQGLDPLIVRRLGQLWDLAILFLVYRRKRARRSRP